MPLRQHAHAFVGEYLHVRSRIIERQFGDREIELLRRHQLPHRRGIPGDDLHPQLRPVLGELREQARQQADGNAGIGCDRKVSAPPGSDLGGNARRVLYGFQRARRLDIEQFGLWRRLQTTAATQEQRQAGFVLQARDRRADPGL